MNEVSNVKTDTNTIVHIDYIRKDKMNFRVINISPKEVDPKTRKAIEKSLFDIFRKYEK